MRTIANTPTPTSGKPSKRRKVKLPHYSRLTSKVVRELDTFVEAVPAKRLSRTIRDMFLHYISFESEVLLYRQNSELPEDLMFLLQFLDTIEEEIQE